MNRELLESQWTQIREILLDKFSNLTEDDIRQINGRYDQLVAKLQQKYGYSREEAEEKIRAWNFDRFATASRGSSAAMREDRTYREDRVRKDETSSILPWLLGIGIPLLLIGAYFLGTRNPETFTSPTSSQEQFVSETPSDRAISNSIRNTLISQQNLGPELQNVQITTNNGIVTLSGTVPDTDTRNTIVSSARNVSGVRQVINNLQVR